MNHKIIDLFVTPLYVTEIVVEDNEIEFIKGLNFQLFDGGTFHEHGIKDRLVLNEPIFFSLKNKIQKALNHFTQDILKYSNEFRITNSWLNLNTENTYHSKHTHSNSLVSGVLYIKVPDDAPGITFYTPMNTNIYLEPKEWNEYNSISQTVQIDENKLILFSSQIYHEVMVSKSKHPRVSLAFNSFPCGELGATHNRLVIK